MVTTKRRAPSPSAPPPMSLTLAQLREGIRAVFYPRVPSHDAASQERIDRATQRVVDAIEAGR